MLTVEETVHCRTLAHLSKPTHRNSALGQKELESLFEKIALRLDWGFPISKEAIELSKEMFLAGLTVGQFIAQDEVIRLSQLLQEKKG